MAGWTRLRKDHEEGRLYPAGNHMCYFGKANMVVRQRIVWEGVCVYYM